MGSWRKITDHMPARYILCFMMFTGFMATFLLRVNINMAIVAMVNTTAPVSDDFTQTSADQCGRNASSANSSVNSNEPQVLGEFEWDEVQQSIILSAFFWGYICFQIPGGRVAEIWGTKRVFGTSILVNGFLNLLIPAAASIHWSLLLIIRALQGLAQGVVFPCVSASVARWVPPEERARFISFAIQGASLGTVVALPLCGWILTHWGWQAVFYVSGCIALIWYAAWFYLIFDSPQQHPRISDKEKSFLERNLIQWKADTPPVPWKSVLTSLQFWVGVSASVGSDWGFHMFCNFGPKFMKNSLGFDLEQSSFWSSLPFLSQYIFSMAFAAFCDYLLQRGLPTMRVRKMSVIVSHILPGIGMVALSLVGCDVTLSVAILTFSVTAIGAISCGFFQNPLDIAPNYAGSLTGVANTLGALTAVVSTPLTGGILQAMGSPSGWHLVFSITAVVYFLSSMPYLLLATGKLQPWNEATTAKKRAISMSNVSIDKGETEISKSFPEDKIDK